MDSNNYITYDQIKNLRSEFRHFKNPIDIFPNNNFLQSHINFF